ncbi:hypothetical protein KC19_12G036200 [Ceratodon purpureus]|uniref:Uncharacterized protein n=1 Tax=Ceratodon purpureus TaxID=3225 RepID=A0A8T0G6Q7_CERPU|nr:hypothetical protein KC19_12G036200 [Ceratodon purpureus]
MNKTHCTSFMLESGPFLPRLCHAIIWVCGGQFKSAAGTEMGQNLIALECACLSVFLSSLSSVYQQSFN